METMVVTLLSVFIFGTLISLFIVGRNTWVKTATYVDLQQTARIAMELIVNELIQSQPAQVTIEPCSQDNPDSCNGDIITFKTPQINNEPVSGTYYTTSGSIKWGADASTAKNIKYIASKEGFAPNPYYANKLLRLAGDVAPPPPPPPPPQDKNPPPGFESFLKRFFLGTAFAEVLDNAANYDIRIIASDIQNLQFKGYAQDGVTQKNNYPDLVEITITTSKRTLLGEELQFSLSSSVTLRN